ncbi:MAG TPA: LysR substrate-binding domain-containing protein [Microvirga sp.]|nr:LysR substrate-binding domain-containing protein [Microvirga sp.]
MDRRWLPLNALRAFEAVAKHGSFTAAAQALLISQSALSRHVIGLEQLIGTQLFERKHHALILTEAGQTLLLAVSRSLDRLEYALSDLMGEKPMLRRNLRVHLPPTFAAHLAVPILRDFRSACPDIAIDFVSPYSVGSPAPDVDIAVVYSKPSVSDAVTDLLWPVRQTMLCHPDLAKRYESAPMAQMIEENELVHVRIADIPRHQMWRHFVREAGLDHVNVERGLVFDTADLAVQYVLSGEGIALIDERLFLEDIKSGRLARPFDLHVENGYGYYLITQPGDLGDTAIALFRSWLIERFGEKSTVPQSPSQESPVRLVHQKK